MTHLLRTPSQRSVALMLLALLFITTNVLLLRGLAFHVPGANGWVGILFRGTVGLGLLLSLYDGSRGLVLRHGLHPSLHHLRLPMRLRNPADLARGGKSQSSPCPRSPGSSSRSERSSAPSSPSSPPGRSSAVRLRRVSPLNRSPPQSPHQPAKTPNPECLIPNSDFQLLTSPLRYASPGQADPRL